MKSIHKVCTHKKAVNKLTLKENDKDKYLTDKKMFLSVANKPQRKN